MTGRITPSHRRARGYLWYQGIRLHLDGEWPGRPNRPRFYRIHVNPPQPVYFSATADPMGWDTPEDAGFILPTAAELERLWREVMGPELKPSLLSLRWEPDAAELDWWRHRIAVPCLLQPPDVLAIPIA